MIRLLTTILLFFVLTVLTQVGGVVFLLSRLVLRFIPLDGYAASRRRWMRVGFHFLFYAFCTYLLVPMAARPFGRVPLPAFERQGLQPQTFFTTLLNRNYVRPQLRDLALDVSGRMSSRYPGFRLNYFDANFPFRISLRLFGKQRVFGLWPHLSHNDGRKLDLGFTYRDASTGELSPHTPSAIGYGISEEPLPGEADEPGRCRQTNRWYNFMRDTWPQGSKADYTFDAENTRELIGHFIGDRRVEKIFLEPHLEQRLLLNSSRITAAGCGAVRHDDHFHVQIH